MASNAAFVGTIPETYDRFLGPLLFEPYAQDMAGRVRRAGGVRVLELACGTGIVTRALLAVLASGGELTATDLNEAMLGVARENAGTDPRLRVQQADACSLPFPDRSFDLIVCQFGVMFFPDKAGSMREARRVLALGGRYLFNVWDSLEHNPIPAAVQESLEELLPSNPPRFLAQTPYGWFDPKAIESTVRAGGFTSVRHDVVAFPSESSSAADAARGLIEGTPILIALSERGITDTRAIREATSDRLAAGFGKAPCRSTMQALVFEVS
jgi:ubiquinone/menaquinone biosynthesis C-methylase UbiE